MQRRQWIQWGLASGAAIALVGGVAVPWPSALNDKGLLTATACAMLTSVGKALLDGSLPSEPVALHAELAGLCTRIESLLTALPSTSRNTYCQLLSALQSPLGRIALTGLTDAWELADFPRVQSALSDMRLSALTVRQQAYLDLRELVNWAYFSDPATWAAMGYPDAQTSGSKPS